VDTKLSSELSVEWIGRGLEYGEMLHRQEELVAERVADPDHVPERLLLLEHAAVYTIGRTPDRSSLLDPAQLPHPLFTIGRGGQATYHGPGQLVGYPILDLNLRGRDLHRHLRAIEELLIIALAQFGLMTHRREGLTGVWVDERKIASIGVGVRRWVSYHGFAVNVTRECLQGFQAITPCGIGGIAMTSLDVEARAPVGVDAFAKVIGKIFQTHLDDLLPRMARPATGS
jgi:lipoyl(octanoyl) transferase